MGGYTALVYHFAALIALPCNMDACNAADSTLSSRSGSGRRPARLPGASGLPLGGRARAGGQESPWEGSNSVPLSGS